VNVWSSRVHVGVFPFVVLVYYVITVAGVTPYVSGLFMILYGNFAKLFWVMNSILLQ
jgi:hypothetical protein